MNPSLIHAQPVAVSLASFASWREMDLAGCGLVWVDGFLQPFTSPWAALTAAALLTAVLALVVFRLCGRQGALRRRKAQMQARLLELDLFKHDLAGVFGAFGRILVSIARYLAASLPALLVLLVPVGLLLVHLADWFECRPLRPGQATVLVVQLADVADPRKVAVSAAASPGIVIEAGPFVAARSGELLWRIRPGVPDANGWIEITLDGKALRKRVCSAAAGRFVRVSQERVRGGVWAGLMHPGEARLPAEGAAVSLRVLYPRRELLLAGTPVNWVLALVVLSLVFAGLLKRPLKVEF